MLDGSLLNSFCLLLWWWSSFFILFLPVWIVRALSSVSHIFSSLVMSRASSCVHSFHIPLKYISFLFAHIPWINESHDIKRPFKVFITISPSSTFSLNSSSCSFIWVILVKWDCMVSEFYIFTFFNRFLNVIFLLRFFPSNGFVKELNTSLGVFKDDTWGMRWSLIELLMYL